MSTSPASQFILQPFFRFLYVTSSSLNSPGEPPMPEIDCPKHLAPVIAIRLFERGRTVDLQEAGWVAAHVEHNVSVVCHCFQQ